MNPWIRVAITAIACALSAVAAWARIQDLRQRRAMVAYACARLQREIRAGQHGRSATNA